MAQNTHPLLKGAEERLNEFERKIVEDDYDSCSDGFYDEFDELKNDLQEFSEIIPDTAETDITVLKRLIKRLQKIASEQDVIDAESDLEMMFPDGED